MSTMDFNVQFIDKILPDPENIGGVSISCDMNLSSMELVVARVREHITDPEWDMIVLNTSN